MSQKLLIRDLTLRDGQQSAFATRMNQQQVDRVLPYYKEANFHAMEVWGGAVPDSVMRYLNENPWDRLEKIKAAVGNVSRLTALSRGRNLFGYAPYPDAIIDGFCKNAIASGLGITRIFDALNDVDNVKSTIKHVKAYGGIADCAVCYTVDPRFTVMERLKAKLKGKPLPGTIFTNEYFLQKAMEMESLGADMITIKDMSGLIQPSRVAELVTLFKKHLRAPLDFHTHCTPGYGLAAVLAAIMNGVDVIDSVIWNFAGGPAAPAIELIYIFCKKLGVTLDVNMEAVARINEELRDIRGELEAFDAVKQFPKPFNPLVDTLPAAIDKEFDNAIAAVAKNEQALLKACHAIEAHFNFPAPNNLVKEAEIPGGMYTNMVAQLKQLNATDILEEAMKLIPTVRLDAGLPPLVTPTSQIVGAQAVNCALDIKNGKQMYTNVSNQFVALVKGEYGKTPVPVDPDFRLKIARVREETPYDTSKYQMQENPALQEFGGVRLAANEKEILLMELFPSVARAFLTRQKENAYRAGQALRDAEKETRKTEEKKNAVPITGKTIESPMPGVILQVLVKPGDAVKCGQEILVLEAMKMENSISSDYTGIVKRILAPVGSNVAAGEKLVEIEVK
ncbi:MAG: carboxylase [Odoribacteraceae bacterium]|jgi:pyruvate/oxaloacetate carboxyltransferase|nr:carboxylase [Odoribacteraceae bacterium]